MLRFVASIEYNGTHYHGWQRLKTSLPTIQNEIEKALSLVAHHPISTICAGRTDAGVHATEQIIHFDSSAKRTMRNWVLGANRYLPDAITIKWVIATTADFHARFSALSRHYRYLIYNHPVRSALFPKTATWCYQPLNITNMQIAANYLIGCHNFHSYRTVKCQAHNPIRTISHLTLTDHKPFVIIDIQANAFLHHMVRNIAGTLIDVGTGKQKPIWVQEVLKAQDRSAGGITAPPNGLYLSAIDYPVQFNLPHNRLKNTRLHESSMPFPI